VAYNFFDITAPDAENERGADLIQLLYSLLALVNGLCVTSMPRWSYAIQVGAGTYYKPDAHRWTYTEDSNEMVQVDMTYDGSDRVATVTLKRSTDGGSNWDTAGAWTNTYDATTSVLTASAWADA
jgi:hypothetical protein